MGNKQFRSKKENGEHLVDYELKSANDLINIHRAFKLKSIPTESGFFSLDGFETDARVSRVVDGDSIHLIFRFRGSFDTWKCRIIGIDTPELRGGTVETKLAAQEAKEYLTKEILGEIVHVYCKEFDSFGRLLIVVDHNGVDIGESLVKLGYAKPFLID